MMFSEIPAAEKAFEREFGTPPRWIARAPGRVNLIGEHTDYNEGFVLPMAIDLATTISGAPNDKPLIRFSSAAMPESMSIDLTKAIRPAKDSPWNYVRGVLALMQAEGFQLPGFDALINSNVPIGSGLSSSAALEVATATLVEVMSGSKLDPVKKALLCQRAEREFAGVPCGIMDQFISTLGCEDNLLLLDCRSHEARWIEFNDPTVSLLIFQTNVRHQLASSQYAMRRAQCEEAATAMGVKSLRDAKREMLEAHREEMDRTIFRRARHVICENTRTLNLVRQLLARDWLNVGQYMYESHQSLQEDFEVSCPEALGDVQWRSSRRRAPPRLAAE
jgi:galactokinase